MYEISVILMASLEDGVKGTIQQKYKGVQVVSIKGSPFNESLHNNFMYFY